MVDLAKPLENDATHEPQSMPMDQIRTSGPKGNKSKAAGYIKFDAIHS